MGDVNVVSIMSTVAILLKKSKKGGFESNEHRDSPSRAATHGDHSDNGHQKKSRRRAGTGNQEELEKNQEQERTRTRRKERERNRDSNEKLLDDGDDDRKYVAGSKRKGYYKDDGYDRFRLLFVFIATCHHHHPPCVSLLQTAKRRR